MLKEPTPVKTRPRLWWITGTDTGVGKTVVTASLARYLRTRGTTVAALKPFCSGNRGDARGLRLAAGAAMSLSEINPWFFRASLTPLLAARREGRRVTLAEAVDALEALTGRCSWTLVEGAGGWLSPLGEGFDARDLVLKLRARVLVVCPNRLGAINQSLLVWGALPPGMRRKALLVLVGQQQPDGSARSNGAILRERLGSDRVWDLPFLGEEPLGDTAWRRATRRIGGLIRRMAAG